MSPCDALTCRTACHCCGLIGMRSLGTMTPKTEDRQCAIAAVSDLAAGELGHLATQPDGDTTEGRTVA